MLEITRKFIIRLWILKDLAGTTDKWEMRILDQFFVPAITKSFLKQHEDWLRQKCELIYDFEQH